MIYIYRVENLNSNCLGEVTAIEYCYQYNIRGVGEAVFNWTVLILEKLPGSNFRITNLYTILSYPESSSSVSCGDTITGPDGHPQKRRCCDVEQINVLNLSANFVFGITGQSQGNTRSATLLGYSDALSQYQVNLILLNNDRLSLSTGSTIPTASVPSVQRGIRQLWFVVGMLSIMQCTGKGYMFL